MGWVCVQRLASIHIHQLSSDKGSCRRQQEAHNGGDLETEAHTHKCKVSFHLCVLHVPEETHLKPQDCNVNPACACHNLTVPRKLPFSIWAPLKSGNPSEQRWSYTKALYQVSRRPHNNKPKVNTGLHLCSFLLHTVLFLDTFHFLSQSPFSITATCLLYTGPWNSQWVCVAIAFWCVQFMVLSGKKTQQHRWHEFLGKRTSESCCIP